MQLGPGRVLDCFFNAQLYMGTCRRYAPDTLTGHPCALFSCAALNRNRRVLYLERALLWQRSPCLRHMLRQPISLPPSPPSPLLVWQLHKRGQLVKKKVCFARETEHTHTLHRAQDQHDQVCGMGGRRTWGHFTGKMRERERKDANVCACAGGGRRQAVNWVSLQLYHFVAP